MLCSSIACCICILGAVVAAINYNDPDLVIESTTVEPVQEVKEAAAEDLGALLDAGDGAAVAVTLVAGGTRLLAHSAVLAARSPVFAAVLQHYAVETSGGRVAVPDVEGPALRQLLAYCYSLQARQLPGMAPQLLAAADRYGVAALKAECEQQLAAQLAVGTAAATAVLAVKHSDDLRQASVSFIKAHLVQVLATKGWADAVINQPREVVKVSQLLSDRPVETRSPSEDEKGRRLIEASEEGAVEKLHSLLAVGADVGARDEGGSTALHWAAFRGHVKASRSLVEGGAEVDARDNWQNTPLHVATWNGHVDVVRLLAASSADPNLVDESGRTPLHWAAVRGHTKVATALLEVGADRRVKDKDGNTPLDIARLNGRQELIDTLRNLSGEEKDRRLIVAVEKGAVEEMGVLLLAGANVGARDKGGNTALHWAAWYGNVEAATCLVECGADVGARNNYKNTPLHWATWLGHAAVVRLLIAASADLNASNQDGWTPLHLAAQYNRAEEMAALLEAGADYGATTKAGETLLDVAKRYNRNHFIDMLRRS